MAWQKAQMPRCFEAPQQMSRHCSDTHTETDRFINASDTSISPLNTPIIASPSESLNKSHPPAPNSQLHSTLLTLLTHTILLCLHHNSPLNIHRHKLNICAHLHPYNCTYLAPSSRLSSLQSSASHKQSKARKGHLSLLITHA